MDTGRYQFVNIYEERMQTEDFHAEMNEYVPLIRDFQYLEKGSELEGWLIFDVPKGSGGPIAEVGSGRGHHHY